MSWAPTPWAAREAAAMAMAQRRDMRRILFPTQRLCAPSPYSFECFVHLYAQGGGQREPELPRSAPVDLQHIPQGLLQRELVGSASAQDAVDIVGGLAVHFAVVKTEADERARTGELRKLIDGGHSMLGGQADHLAL